MAENLYSDGPESEDMESENDMGGKAETTTIPKSLCPGMKVGDSVELKIVGELDSEYEVSYEESESEEPEAPEMPEQAPPQAPMPMAGPQGGGMADMMA